MKKSAPCLFLFLVVLSGGLFAQTSTIDGVRESTSPSRAADVERKAEDISGQSSSATGDTGEDSKPHKKAQPSKKKSGQHRASGRSGASGIGSGPSGGHSDTTR